jgi:fibronectin-binding autotransporter adhesin
MKTQSAATQFKPSFLLIAVLCVCRATVAQDTYTWNGGGTDGNWVTGANWIHTAGSGAATPSSPQAFLNFTNNVRLLNTNNFAAGSGGFQIYFKTASGAFSLYGTGINFYDYSSIDPNIQNEGAFTNQSIYFPITNANTHVQGTVRVLNINSNTSTAQGPLTFYGPIGTPSDSLARALNIWGTNTVTFFGPISDGGSGSAMGVSQLGTGNTVLAATNSYVGQTTVNGGTLTVSNNASIAASSFVKVNTGGALSVFGTGKILGNVEIASNTAASQNASISGTIAGNLTIDAGNTNVTPTASGIYTSPASGFVQANLTASIAAGGFITNQGVLNLTGNSALTLGTIVGPGSDAAGTLGGILDNNTNSKTLTLGNGSAFAFYKPAGGIPGTTLQIAGNGSAFIKWFGYNDATGIAYTNILNGGSWTIANVGQNNSGAHFAGTLIITNNAVVNITNNINYIHGNWSIVSNSSVSFNQAAKSLQPGHASSNIGLNIGVSNNGSLFAGANGISLGFASGTGVANSAPENNSLTIGSGGTVVVTNNLSVGAGAANTAAETNTVNLSGGKLLITSTLNVGSANNLITNASPYSPIAPVNIFNWTGGQLSAATINCSNGLVIIGVTNTSNAFYVTNPAIFNSGNFSSTTLTNNAGTLAPGDTGSGGKTAITGNYVQTAGGTLDLDIAGTTQASAFQSASSYDLLAVSGNASLAGNLIVRTNSALTGVSSTTAFTVLTTAANGLSGTFANTYNSRVPVLGGNGASLQAIYGTGSLILSNYSPLTAGFNITSIGATNSPTVLTDTSVGAITNWSLNWGDGAVSNYSSSAAFNFGTHQYAATFASYTLTLTVTASDGTTASTTGSVSIAGPLTWVGDGTANVWDINTTANWNNGAGATKYIDASVLRFDDTGSTSPNISLGVTVTPGSMTFSNVTKNYTISPSGPSGLILGSGPLMKYGSGTLTIATTNTTYAGAITVNAGTLALGPAASVGTGLLTLNNGTTFAMANSGGSAFLSNPVFIPAGASVTFSTTALGNGINGNVSSGDNTSVINISGSVSFNASSRQLDSFTGTVNVPAGATLRFSSTSAGDGSTNAAFVVNGLLQPRNANIINILGSLSGSGALGGPQSPLASTSPVTYYIGTNNASTTFSGQFREVNLPTGTATTNNPTTIVKFGTGTLTLSGVSTNSGTTTVAVGALIGVTGGALSNSPVTVASGATNGVNITVPGNTFTISNLTYNSGTCVAQFGFGANTPSTSVAPLTVQNNVAINGTLNVQISGNPLPTGTYPLIKYNGTQTGSAVQTPLAQPARTLGYITNDTANKLISYVVTNATGPIVWQPGSGLWDTATANWKDQTGASTTYLDGADAVRFDETPANAGPFLVTNNSALSSPAITVSNVTKNYTFTSGNLGGAGSLTKVGTGSLVLLGTNTFTGGTTITGGTLQCSTASLPGSILDNAALVFDQAFTGTETNVISGSGSVTKQNTGTVIITKTNTYTGGTTISGGTLQLGDGATSLGALAGNVTNNANLIFADATTQTFGNQISGSGAVTKNGAGQLNLGGSSTNTYTGITTVNAGTLAFNSAAPNTNAIGGDLLINAGASVIYNTARDEQIPDTANITNLAGTLTFGARTEHFNFLHNNGGTNTVGSGLVDATGGGYSTNGYFNCTSSGIFEFSNNVTVINGMMDITYAGSSTAGYRLLGPDNTGLFIPATATAATTFTNQGNASSGARFLFGPSSTEAPTTQTFTSVINVQDIPGVDPDLNMGLKMTMSSGFNGNIRKDGNGKMAITIPTSTSFTPTNFIVNQGTLAVVGNGTLYFAQNIIVNAGATLDYSGVAAGTYSLTNSQNFKGNGTIVGTLTNGNSLIAPGDVGTNGSLTINGNLDNSGNSALLAFDLSSPTNFDFLAITGNFTMGGTLNLNLLGGYLPQTTDSFTIITNGGTLAGAFANQISGGRVSVTSNPTYSFQIVATGNSVVLTNFSLTLPVANITLASTNITYGSSVTFTANILAGVPTFTYQWRDRSSNSILGATNSILTLVNPTVAASGNYSVIVANAYGSVTNFATLTVNPATPALSLAASANPAGFHDTLNFTAVLPTDATGLVTFSANGSAFSTNTLASGSTTSGNITTLPRGTNLVTAIYNGDGNYLPNTNSLNQIVTNHPPVAANLTFNLGSSPTWKLKLSELITNTSDSDGDSLTITAIGSSTNGITLTTNSGFVFYVNTNLVNDQFTYTVDDGFGGTATATISLNAQNVFSGQPATIAVGDSTATLHFAGIPGFNYTVERSVDLTSWTDITTTNAPAGGLFDVVDNFSDLGSVPSSAYYRLKWQP